MPAKAGMIFFPIHMREAIEMTDKVTELVQAAVQKLTKDQIAQALELAASVNYDKKADPAFVGSVLVAIATNTATLAAEITARQK